MNIRKTIAVSLLATATMLSMASAVQAQYIKYPLTFFPPLRVAKPSPVKSSPEVAVCFYTQTDFKGQYYCERGLRRVSKVDAKWRDRIESVQVINNASITICEDFNRQGTCQTLSKDSPELAPELINHLYSYKIKR